MEKRDTNTRPGRKNWREEIRKKMRQTDQNGEAEAAKKIQTTGLRNSY